MGDYLFLAIAFFLLGGVAIIVGILLLLATLFHKFRSLKRPGLIFILCGTLFLLAGGTFCTANFRAIRASEGKILTE